MKEIITREQAIELGLRRYFTGVPCEKHGHVCERVTGDYSCVDCRNLRRNTNRAANRQQVRDKNNAYLAKNRDRAKAWWAKHYAKNAEHHRRRATLARQKDIQVRIAHRLRERLRKAIRGQYKTGSAVSDLGCTIIELIAYMQQHFLPGMSWDNWGDGPGKWHIDHHRPLASFDLTDPLQLKQAVHFTNLRPLWWEENLKKGATLIA